jgi:hypothetical protein
VKHLEIENDLLVKSQMMATVVRQGWTLSLVFEVGHSDGDGIEKTKFGHEEVHSHELGMMVGITTQSIQDMGEFNVRIHGIIC